MIYCCKGCEAPKRYPGCHGVCQDYLEQKKEYDRLKAEYDKVNQTTGAIVGAQINKVYKAQKGLRCKKY
jgi:hypothetical protein